MATRIRNPHTIILNQRTHSRLIANRLIVSQRTVSHLILNRHTLHRVHIQLIQLKRTEHRICDTKRTSNYTEIRGN